MERARGGSAGAIFWLRLFVVLAASGLILWLTVALSVALVIGPRNPDLALRFGARTADVESAAALQILRRRPRPAGLERARSLALSALRAEPMNIQALDVLGFLAVLHRRDAQAKRLFDYSESLSRRDLPTQLWQIEYAVGRNDIGGALVHYDRALRTSSEAPQLLFPILRRAAADPAIGMPLARMVNARPPWWMWFAYSMLEDAQTSPEAFFHIFGRLRLDIRESGERELLTGAIGRLLAVRRYRMAYGIYRSHAGVAGDGGRLLRDGGFERELRVPPFDWYFTDEADLSAVRERVGAGQGDFALRLYASGGRDGEAVRQLLLLPAGAYAISLKLGSSQGEEPYRPLLTLRCATDEAPLASFRLPAAPDSGRQWQGRLSVPQGCPAQWLGITIRSNIDAETSPPWIDAVDLRPSRP